MNDEDPELALGTVVGRLCVLAVEADEQRVAVPSVAFVEQSSPRC